MNHIRLSMVTAIFLLLTGVVLASSPLPVEYNWCSDPDVWGDGRCDAHADPDMVRCHWQIGWYLPRVGNGEFNMGDVKTHCVSTIADVDVEVYESIDESTGCTRLIIVLNGSSYSGTYDVLVSSDDYDGSDATCGLTIHGNSNDNTIVGGSGDDEIYGYEGNDTISGEGGNDTIYGGDESCSGRRCNEGHTLGDTINGGAGNDTIYGGDESCSGRECNTDGNLGDTIDGGTGNDTVNGGNESCSGNQCNLSYSGDNSNMGDTIIGTNPCGETKNQPDITTDVIK